MKKAFFILVTLSLLFLPACSKSGEKEYFLGGVYVPEKTGESLTFSGLFCAVVYDGSGKIAACKIDSVEAKAGFNDIDTHKGKEYKSKVDLGDGYGMKKASPIGKEWFEQARAFEEWCVGKTKNQIASGLNGDGKVADLTSSCTVYAGEFVKAVAECFERGKLFKADELDLGIKIICAGDRSSSPADNLKDGKAVFDCVLAASVTDKNGVVLAAFVDQAEAAMDFSSSGVNLSADKTFQSKYNLGSSYGMKKASPIAKEWYEQTDALCGFLVGKVLDEAVNYPDSSGKIADLKSSCTVNVSPYIRALKESGVGK